MYFDDEEEIDDNDLGTENELESNQASGEETGASSDAHVDRYNLSNSNNKNGNSSLDRNVNRVVNTKKSIDKVRRGIDKADKKIMSHSNKQPAQPPKPQPKRISNAGKNFHGQNSASNIKKAGKTAAKATKGPIATGCGVVVTVIVVIMLLIGFVSFIMNMPNNIIGKIMEFWDDKWTAGRIFFGTAPADAALAQQNVIKTAQYLENMGYDLAGYGFLEGINLNDKGEEVEGQVEYFAFSLTRHKDRNKSS